jgi:iron complex outermembrane receptor protein
LRTVGCHIGLLATLLAALPASSQPRALPADAVRLEIAAQPLGDALSRLAEAAGIQIVFDSEAVSGLTSNALTGMYSVADALTLLLAESALEYEFLSPRSIAVRPRAEPRDRASSARDDSEPPPVDRRARRGQVAQSYDPRKLEEIIVIARRQSESLQSAPIAVTAMNTEALELRSAHTAEALTQFVPNLQLDGAAPLSGAAYNATIFMRGVGQNDFAIFSDPGVAVYLDDVYLGRSIGGAMDLLDLAQVEVLRGPQGTLFGRNTIGGAIILRSQEPEKELSREVSLTAGSLHRRELRGVLNVPLNARTALRISAATLQRDGYARRLTDGEQLGDKDAIIGRAQVTWEPNEFMRGRFTFDASGVRQNSAALTLLDVETVGVPFLHLFNSLIAPGAGVQSPGGTYAIDRSWVTHSLDTTYAGGTTLNDLNTMGAALTFEWQLERFALKSISAWRDLQAVFARDGDNTPFTFRETFNDDRQSQLSQEVQLSGASEDGELHWIAGLYVFREDATEHGRAMLAPGLYAALNALDLQPDETWCGLPGENPRPVTRCPPALRFGGERYRDNNVLADLDVDLYTRVANRSGALFAQGTYRFAERWGLTGGLRWTFDRKRIELIHQRRGSGVYVVGAPGTERSFAASWSQVTPKLGVEWQASNDALLYFSYARGFKSGGFNGRPLVDSSEVRAPYDPEVVDSYEFGAKTRWLDGRMTANAAVFYNQYRDMQLSINATPQNFVRNAGAARIAGAELEVAARLAAGLDLNLAVSHLDAAYTRLDAQLAELRPPLTRDKHLIKAPRWTATAGLQYRWSLSLGTLTLRGDYSYRDRVYHDVFNHPRLIQPAFELVNAYLSLRTLDRRWEFTLSGTNLTDERYRISGNSSESFGLTESTFSAPREFAASVKLRY